MALRKNIAKGNELQGLDHLPKNYGILEQVGIRVSKRMQKEPKRRTPNPATRIFRFIWQLCRD